MLDIKVIRDNPDEVTSRLATRNKDYSAEINKIITLDKDRRNLISATEAVKAHKNEISKKIPEMKKQNLDVTAIFEEMKKLSDEMKEDEDKLAAIDKELEKREKGDLDIEKSELSGCNSSLSASFELGLVLF